MNDAPKIMDACPTCHTKVGRPARFCVICGTDFGKEYISKTKPTYAMPVKKTYWTLKCRSCSKLIEPEDAFEREMKFYSGWNDERYEPVTPPPDPWAGKAVLTGGMAGETLSEMFNTDPDVRKQMQDDPLWARREIAKSVLRDMPRPLHYTLIRALVLPCAACGEADPLGIV